MGADQTDMQHAAEVLGVVASNRVDGSGTADTSTAVEPGHDDR